MLQAVRNWRGGELGAPAVVRGEYTLQSTGLPRRQPTIINRPPGELCEQPPVLHRQLVWAQIGDRGGQQTGSMFGECKLDLGTPETVSPSAPMTRQVTITTVSL